MGEHMNLVSLKDWKKEDIMKVIDTGIKIKENPEKYSKSLDGKTLAMIFQKTSTRTRASFEVGMTQLGGHGMYLDWSKTNFVLGSLEDEIKCLARYVDIIMARVYKNKDILDMAEASSVPVINGLCDMYHPCQILADLMTMKEKLKGFPDIKVAYVGDGNNVCNSLIIGCSKLGISIAVATPEGYEPDLDKWKYVLTNDPGAAVKGADVIYTDTWISMGQEDEKNKRMKVFPPYQVNMALVGKAKKHVIVMHCLPAHRGYEISDEVIDSEKSVVFDEAENRLHVQKALLLELTRKNLT